MADVTLTRTCTNANGLPDVGIVVKAVLVDETTGPGARYVSAPTDGTGTWTLTVPENTPGNQYFVLEPLSDGTLRWRVYAPSGLPSYDLFAIAVGPPEPKPVPWSVGHSMTGNQGEPAQSLILTQPDTSTVALTVKSAGPTYAVNLAEFQDSDGLVGTTILSNGGMQVLDQIYLSNPFAVLDTSAPPTPSTGCALYTVKNAGTGKNELRVLFPTGASQLLATEP